MSEDNAVNMENAEAGLRLENQLCFPLYAAARKVTNLYTPLFKPLGITYTQYLVFMVLWEKDGLTVGELCHRLYLDSGTITPMLKKLADRGLIRRERCTDDERVVCIFLTEEGRALKNQALEIPQRVGCCIHLSPEEAATLYQLLYKVLNDL